MKTYLIYLAAGNSRRFASNKLLYEYNGKPLYRHALDRLRLSQHELIVVTQYDEIYETLKSHCQVVKSELSHLGLSYTIKAGLDLLKDKERPFQMVFIVADQPYLTLESVEKLIAESEKHHVLLATMAYQDSVGNPTLFHSDYFDELMNLEADQGGRVILKKYKEEVLYVYRTDEQEFLDIDYMEDIVK